jgi:hypothetical protein
MLRVFVRCLLKYIEDDHAGIRAFMLGLGGAHRFNDYSFQRNRQIPKL